MEDTLKSQILAVDDNPVNLEALLGLLGVDYDLRVASDGKSALALIDKGFIPDLILLDILMPGMDGYELCQHFKTREELNGVPFIFLSALDKEEDEALGLQLGAADYIGKPFQPAILLQRIKLHLELKSYRVKLQLLVAEKTQKLKQAEQHALQQEALYRELFNNMGNAVVVCDALDSGAEFIVRNLNRSGVSVFRKQLPEVIGNRLSELIPDAEKVGLLLAMRRVWTSGSAERLPAKRYQSGQRNLWIDSYLYKLPSGQVVGIFDDITKRKEIEAKIIQAKEEWEKTFDAMADCVTILDSDLRIIRANKATHDLFAAPYNSLTGKKCHELFSGTDTICNDCPAVTTLQEFTVCSQTRTHDYLEKTFDISCSLLEGEAGGPSYLIHVARDVTEHSRLQEEVNRANRLASIGELAAGVAHEINNPNGLILHNSRLVMDVYRDLLPVLEKQLPEEKELSLGGLDREDIFSSVPQMLDDIHGASRRIKQIVTELRDFSCYDNNDPLNMVDLNQVVRSSVYLVKNTLKQATADFKVELAPDLPTIRGIPTRLEQVIINLLINASQALESPMDSISIATEYDRPQELVRVLVRDTGSGIPSELRDHICEPFVTTKRQKGGAGLGLSVSTRIIKAHNGKLRFVPNQQKGTIAIVELPAGENLHGED